MIIASVEFLEIAKKNIFFRGKDIAFWVKQIFSDLTFEEPEHPVPDIRILFDPHTFLKIESAGVRELLGVIRNLDDKHNIYSIDGNPLFVIPIHIYNQFKSDIYKKIKKYKNIKTFQLKNTHEVLDLKKDTLEIESCIVNFQIKEFTRKGVLIDDYNSFYIEGMIPIGRGTKISSGVVIKGNTRIGQGVNIFPNVYIENSIVQDNCNILPGCVIRDSKLEQNVQIGPYTHLRSGCVVKKGAKMGNFVEMKKSELGEGSKSMHLTYIGDATVGKNVNIGAGTITCNYDGQKKYRTIIEDNVFIGSGTELIAPVKIKKNSYVGAGSTISKDVPENSLGIARPRQRNLRDWVKKRKQKKKN